MANPFFVDDADAKTAEENAAEEAAFLDKYRSAQIEGNTSLEDKLDNIDLAEDKSFMGPINRTVDRIAKTQQHIALPLAKAWTDRATDPMAQLETINQAGLGVMRGVVNTAETINKITPLGDLQDNILDTTGLTEVKNEVDQRIHTYLNEDYAPTNTLDQIVSGFGQLVLPIGPAIKATDAVMGVARRAPEALVGAKNFWKFVASDTIGSTVAFQFAFDPNESNMMNALSDAIGPTALTEALSADPLDEEWKNRIRMATIDLPLNLVGSTAVIAIQKSINTAAARSMNTASKTNLAVNSGLLPDFSNPIDDTMFNQEVTFTYNPQKQLTYTDPYKDYDGPYKDYIKGLSPEAKPYAINEPLMYTDEWNQWTKDLPPHIYNELYPPATDLKSLSTTLKPPPNEIVLDITGLNWSHPAVNEYLTTGGFLEDDAPTATIEGFQKWLDDKGIPYTQDEPPDLPFWATEGIPVKDAYWDSLNQNTYVPDENQLFVENDGRALVLSEFKKQNPQARINQDIDLVEEYYGLGNDESQENSGMNTERDPTKVYGPLGENFWKMSEQAREVLKSWKQSPKSAPELLKGHRALYSPDGKAAKSPKDLFKDYVNFLESNGIDLGYMDKKDQDNILKELANRKAFAIANDIPNWTDMRVLTHTDEISLGDTLQAGPAYDESKAISREIYANGKAVRDYLAPFADKDGYLWLYRGTSNFDKESPNAIRSYSVKPIEARKFGARVYVDKVHVSDVVNVGVPREAELLIRTPFDRTSRKNIMPGLPKIDQKVLPFTGTPKSANDNVNQNIYQDNGNAAPFSGIHSKMIEFPPKAPEFGTPANDNAPGGGMQADAEVPPPESGKGWFIGRDDSGDLMFVTETGHYLTVPDRPGTTLNYDVSGLATVKQKVGTVGYWLNRLAGKETPDQISRVVTAPTPAFTRNENGDYISDNRRHTIVRKGKSWVMYSDNTAQPSAPIDTTPYEIDTQQVLPGMPADIFQGNAGAGATPGKPEGRDLVVQRFKSLNKAIEASTEFERKILEEADPGEFAKLKGRNYNESEQANQLEASTKFTTADRAADARWLDKLAKNGGKTATLSAWIKNTMSNLRMQTVDGAVYLDKVGEKAFGFQFSSPEDMVTIHKMITNQIPTDWDHPFFKSGAYEAVVDVGVTPYSSWSRTASTGYRINSFIEKGALTHPGEPINRFDAEGTLIAKGDDRPIKYALIPGVRPYAEIYQEALNAGDLEEFQMYFAARVAGFRAEERGVPSSIENYGEIIDRVNKDVDPEKAARFNKWIDQIQDTYASVLDYYQASGMSSKDAVARMRIKNTPKGHSKTLYNPFYYDSMVDKGPLFEAKSGSGFSRLKAMAGISAKDAEEKGLKLITPFEAGIKYIHSMVRAADLNYAKLVTVRYTEDAIRRGHDVGIEFAPQRLTSQAAPNWSINRSAQDHIKDLIEKQIDHFTGIDGSGKSYLTDMYAAIGDDLGMDGKEVAGHMDSGYSTLIGFGKGKMMTDKSGNTFLIDIVFDDGVPKIFKVTDPQAIAFFTNGGQLPDDPIRAFAQNDLVNSAAKWIVNGTKHPVGKYANFLSPGGIARFTGSMVTNAPWFPIWSFIRDSKGNAVGSVLMKTGTKTESMVRAAREAGEITADRTFFEELLANGGSYTRRSEIVGMHSSKGSAKALGQEVKSSTYLSGTRTNNMPSTIRRLTNGVTWSLDKYMSFVEISEMAPRMAEARLAKELGMSMDSASFLARMTSGGDLARRGNSPFIRGFFQTIPFMGSNLQGLLRMADRTTKTMGGLKNSVVELAKGDNGSFTMDADTLEQIPNPGRLSRAKDKLTQAGTDRFLMGITTTVLPAAYMAYVLNAYYKDEYSQITDQQKANFSYIPLYDNLEDATTAQVSIMKRMLGLAGDTPEEIEKNAPIPPARGLMNIGPLAYDWGVVANSTRSTVDVFFQESKGLAERYIGNLTALLPGNMMPAAPKPIVDVASNKNAFGTPLTTESEKNNRLPEDVSDRNTSLIAYDTAKFLNKGYRSLFDKEAGGVFTATEMDVLINGYMPGLAANLIDLAEATDRAVTDRPKVLDERTFKALQDLEKITGEKMNWLDAPVVGMGLDVLSRGYIQGNQKMQDIYDFKRKSNRWAGSFNLRKDAIESGAGGAVPEFQSFIEMLQGEYGPNYEAKLVAISPKVNELVKTVQKYEDRIRMSTDTKWNYFDDEQIAGFYTTFKAADKEMPADTSPEMKRGWVAQKFTKARDIYLNGLSRALAEIPKDDEEMSKLSRRGIDTRKLKGE